MRSANTLIVSVLMLSAACILDRHTVGSLPDGEGDTEGAMTSDGDGGADDGSDGGADVPPTTAECGEEKLVEAWGMGWGAPGNGNIGLDVARYGSDTLLVAALWEGKPHVFRVPGDGDEEIDTPLSPKPGSDLNIGVLPDGVAVVTGRTETSMFLGTVETDGSYSFNYNQDDGNDPQVWNVPTGVAASAQGDIFRAGYRVSGSDRVGNLSRSAKNYAPSWNIFIGDGYDYINDVVVVDEQVILVGEIGGDGWVLSYAFDGSLNWERSIEGGPSEYWTSVAVSPDGELILGGICYQDDEQWAWYGRMTTDGEDIGTLEFSCGDWAGRYLPPVIDITVMTNDVAVSINGESNGDSIVMLRPDGEYLMQPLDEFTTDTIDARALVAGDGCRVAITGSRSDGENAFLLGLIEEPDD